MIAKTIAEQMERGSWIRRIFEEGLRLRKERGPENVYDFSLGNPSADTPRPVAEALERLASERPGRGHGYMTNAGYPAVREAVAERLRQRTGLAYTADHIVMTVGAAGAVNTVLKAVLDAGDEVIVPIPYFPEYAFYLANYAARMVPVETTAEFQLDIEAIERALSPRTKAILINSPNNPTGALYEADTLDQLDRLLARHGGEVLVVSDEPYRELVYDGTTAPETPVHITRSAVAYSWSKSFGLAGERIGYLALSPRIPEAATLHAACCFNMRALGYVNAPATWQWVVKEALDTPADTEEYRTKIAVMCDGLERIGFRLVRPGGGFYLFPQTPTPDDWAFVNALQNEGILTVPGSSFGRGGHIRLSLTVPLETVERSLPGFERAFHNARR